MRTSSIELDYKESYIKEQLHKSGYTETDGLSYRDLVKKLSVIRAMEEME